MFPGSGRRGSLAGDRWATLAFMMFVQILLTCSLLGIIVSDCERIEGNRGSFDDVSSITADLDGDRKPDRIMPRTYTVTAKSSSPSQSKPNAQTHWIAFDLKTSKGRVQNSFFRYRYGTNEADYWVYALMPCDVNKDGRIDLVFYSGDDTSDEMIILLNREGKFRIHSRRKSGAEDWVRLRKK